ncbi:MAG TPA: two-component system regulatory protein YycI [Bacillota bacterium]|nr:two-component system regulatory protein YycI [Bacillota bacterium]
MQWGQIKTLFIVCFLILDVYLLVKFIDKQQQAELSVMEQENTSIEQQLKSENITLPELPTNNEEEENYISVSPRIFSEDDLSDFDNLKKASIIDGNLIVSSFKEPISIPENGSGSDIKSIFSDELLNIDDYRFWSWNKELNMLIFFQEKEDRPIYYNENGIIFIFLNDDDEAIFYTQTMLEKMEANGDKYPLIEPIKSIEILYDFNELQPDDVISGIGMGFHTRLPLESGIQVFSPTWRVTVNGDRNYFVNAIEGIVYSSLDINFLKDSLIDISQKADAISDKDYKEQVKKLLESRVNLLEGGEIEK